MADNDKATQESVQKAEDRPKYTVEPIQRETGTPASSSSSSSSPKYTVEPIHRTETADSTSPIPENYGFTPRHMAGAAWEGLGNIASAVYGVGKDLISSKTPVFLSDEPQDQGSVAKRMQGDTLINKYLIAPAAAEEKKAQTAKTGIESIGHSVAEAIPVIGPIAAHIAERAGTGDIGGAAAEGTTYVVAPKVAEKVVPPVVKGVLKRIPLINEIPDAIAAAKDRYIPSRSVKPAPTGLAETLKSTEQTVEPLIKEVKAAKPVPTDPNLVGNDYVERVERAIPESKNVIENVEQKANELGATLPAESKSGYKPISQAKVEQALNRALGNEPLKPNVPLREQNLIPKKTETATEAKLSSDPRKAALQKAGATPEEIETILYKTRSGTGPTKVEMSRLAQHFDVDLGESAIGRGKADVEAGTHLTPHEVLQRILSEHTPTEVAKAIDEGKHLVTVSGASQGYVPMPNASGESAASMEAIGRMASEKGQGLKRIVVDTRSGAERPLIGPDAVDYEPRPYEQVEFRGGDRDGEIISLGSKARRKGLPKINLSGGTDVAQHDVLQRILKNHSPAEIARAIDEGKHLPTVSGGSQGADQLAPTFYSKAAKVAEEKVSTGPGESVLATLRNNGVKESEIQWLGLDDYLMGKPKVSKADLQQYINEHKIKLDEVNLGGSDWKNVRDLTVQRNKVYAENNRLWADHLKYVDGSTDLFNAMKEGGDIEPVIAKMPAAVQEPARRFVETDQTIRQLDKQIGDAEATVKPSKYESYTLPGDKDNYTEKLLTLPGQGRTVAQIDSEMDSLHDALDAGRINDKEFSNSLQRLQFERNEVVNSKQFRSSHFDEPNVLAHVRYDDRASVDGKKTLFLEELQSDWHQKGKKEGYQNTAPTKLPDGIFIVPEEGKFQVVNREGNPLLSRLFTSEQEARTAALTHYGEGAGKPGVPNAPFKTDWHELVLKRMLRHAAENGYDRLAWTTGEQQAARYDLSKHIQSVEYYPETQTLDAYDHSGKRVMSESGVEPNRIPDYIGKEAAAKLTSKINEYSPLREEDFSIDEDPERGFIVRDPNGDPVYTTSSPLEAQKEIEYLVERDRNQYPTPRVSGLDLKVGGDWAKGLYDRAIPNFLNKYAKKWGAKVDTTELSTTNEGSLRYEIVDPKGNVYDAFRNRAGADGAVKGYNEAHRGSGKWTVRDTGTTEKVHSIEITPAMKKSVLHEGQPISKGIRPILPPAKETPLGRIQVA